MKSTVEKKVIVTLEMDMDDLIAMKRMTNAYEDRMAGEINHLERGVIQHVAEAYTEAMRVQSGVS